MPYTFYWSNFQKIPNYLQDTFTLFCFQRSFTVSFNRKELAEALGMDEQVLKPFNSILKAIRDNDVDAIKNRMTDNFVDEYDSFKNDFKDYLNHFVKKFESDSESAETIHVGTLRRSRVGI